MIEIKPILTTQPIKKITKIIREHQPPKQHPPQEQNNKDDSSDDTEQHIDEIV